jgi:hypothetical protein
MLSLIVCWFDAWNSIPSILLGGFKILLSFYITGLFGSWLALARLEAKWGNIEKSREVFAKSLQKCPNNIHILQAWGHMEQVTNLLSPNLCHLSLESRK